MGIYRTLLEEEVPHLDDNNNPDDQIKELQDVIEDQDANQAEQDAAQDAEFGPDCGVDDIMDESAMAIYEFESGHADIMQAIGLHELHEATAGREFIFEAADVKGFFTSIKTKIKNFFTKVWQVIQRWAGNLKAQFTNGKKFIEKFGDKIEKGYNEIDKSKKAKGYKFNFKEIDQDVKDTGKLVDEGKASVSDITNAINSGSDIDNAMTAEDVEAAVNAARGKLCGGNESISASDFSSKLKISMFGSSEPVDMWMEPKDIKDILSDKKNLSDATKKFAKEAKEQFKKVMSNLDKLERSASKIEDATQRNKMMAICTRYSTMVRSVLTATQTWRSARLNAIAQCAHQARRFGMMYVRAANKKEKRGFQKESAEYGFLGSMGLV